MVFCQLSAQQLNRLSSWLSSSADPAETVEYVISRLIIFTVKGANQFSVARSQVVNNRRPQPGGPCPFDLFEQLGLADWSR
jgi:hypothetical protein